MHKYGDEHPESGLKNKLKGFQFKQNLEIMDPIKRTITKEPMKPFMVNQLAIAFERNNIILSPFDDTLHKQLIDYEVVKIGANGNPVYTDENEHFVDALGLAYLAFVLEFPDITKTIYKTELGKPAKVMTSSPLNKRVENVLSSIQKGTFASTNPWTNLRNGSFTPERAADPDERDVPRYFRCDPPVQRRSSRISWGARDLSGGFSRRTW